MSKSYQKVTDRHRLTPSSKSINSALLSLKKTKRWIWVRVDSSFGKVLGFVYGGRTIKTESCYKNLTTLVYGIDCLGAYKDFIQDTFQNLGKRFRLL